MAEESTRSPVRLMNFVSEEQAAVAVQSMIVHELKETPPVPVVQEQKAAGKKNPPARPIGMIIKVKPQAKKACSSHYHSHYHSVTITKRTLSVERERCNVRLTRLTI
ncbi:uncharacterized protein LOC112095371 [Morus notabilis]|uniref:uncharacterized protein LOC112095371 n=1 Tax=Morus notabilis TaxID=981085 RepID=UPI000CED2EA4|nr:uncharacterized protein LOC112095371 [Morus notabilis]